MIFDQLGTKTGQCRTPTGQFPLAPCIAFSSPLSLSAALQPLKRGRSGGTAAVETTLLRMLLGGSTTLHAGASAGALTAAALNLPTSCQQPSFFFRHAFSFRSCTTVLSRCRATGKEVSAPATLRLISERLRGRLSESVFVFIMGLQAGKGPGREGWVKTEAVLLPATHSCQVDRSVVCSVSQAK